jgi:hypothetical protein
MKLAFNYELELLDELISETLHPKKLIDETAPITSRQVNTWLNTALTEKNKIRKRLKPVTYGLLKEKHKRLYIQQQQSALIRLLDALYNYLAPADPSGMVERNVDSPLEKLYKRLFTYCQELLNYIQDTFPEYFINDLKAPEYDILRVQDQWRLRLPALRRKLLKLGSDKLLVQLFFSLLNNISEPTVPADISYRTIEYINQLLTALENLDKTDTTRDYFHSFIVTLVYRDFNETDFKNYLVEIICEVVNAQKTIKEKIDKLSFFFKEISQMHSKPGISFHPDAPSLKEDMKKWLSGEIKYLEKSENLGIIVPARFHDTPQYKRGIWYTYNIKELALLQRVQHDAGYITNQNIVTMMEDFSKIAHTSTQHNISFKNLKNLFYNIDLDTIDSLHEKFLILIRKLQNLKAEIIKKEKAKRK